MANFYDLIARVAGTSAAQARLDCAAPIRPLAAPAIAEERRLVPAYLSGRCANGYARDSGRVVHAVEATVRETRTGIGAYARALCGVTHGARSAGWCQDDDGARYTCAKCARLAAAR